MTEEHQDKAHGIEADRSPESVLGNDWTGVVMTKLCVTAWKSRID